MLQPGPIDTHAHYLAKGVVDLCLSGALAPGTRARPDGRVVDVGGFEMVRNPEREGGVAGHIAGMDGAGIAVQVLSPNPIFLHYWDTAANALKVAAAMNDGIAEAVRARPDRFLGLASVPLQDVDLALKEATRAMDELGMVGFEIGTHVGDRNLDDPALLPFFAEVARRDACLLIHPSSHDMAGMDRLGSYHLSNLIGNPTATSIALASLIFGGVLGRFPGLRIVLCHGGGFVPYQLGRWDHGHSVRPEARIHEERPPSQLLENVWFDCLLHSDRALEYLIDFVGADKVVLGTDYPADMGDLTGVERVRKLAPDDADRILETNALRWLGRKA